MSKIPPPVDAYMRSPHSGIFDADDSPGHSLAHLRDIELGGSYIQDPSALWPEGDIDRPWSFGFFPTEHMQKQSRDYALDHRPSKTHAKKKRI